MAEGAVTVQPVAQYRRLTPRPIEIPLAEIESVERLKRWQLPLFAILRNNRLRLSTGQAALPPDGRGR